MADKGAKKTASRTGGKKVNSKPRGAKKNTGSKSREPNGLVYLITITVCILLVIYTYTSTEAFGGTAVKNFLFGIFGICAYCLPVAAIACMVYLCGTKDINKFTAKLIMTFFLLWDAAAVIHIASGEANMMSSAQEIISAYNGPYYGGVLGACISYPLNMLTGSAAAVIILSAVGIVLISMITKISVAGIVADIVVLIRDIIKEMFTPVEKVDTTEFNEKITGKVRENKKKIYETTAELNETTKSAVSGIKNMLGFNLDFKMKENEGTVKENVSENTPELALENEMKRAEELQRNILNNVDAVICDDKDDEKPLLREQMEKIYGKKNKEEKIIEFPEDFVPAIGMLSEEEELVQSDTGADSVDSVVTDNTEDAEKIISEENNPESVQLYTADYDSISENDSSDEYDDFIEEYKEESDKPEMSAAAETGIENTVFNVMGENNTAAEKSSGEKEPVEEFIRTGESNKAQTTEKVSKTYTEPKEETALADLLNDAAEIVHKPYVYPDIDLLKRPKAPPENFKEEMRATAMKLIETLKSFNVNVKLSEVTQGPAVTRYEVQLEPGVKVSKIVGLSEDLAMNLAVSSILIAPVPGKPVIGIEVPNKKISMVSVRELIDSDEFRSMKSKLAFVVGKDIGGRIITADIAKMPHLLIAGSTGSGKSVFVNTMITSILYNASPDEVKLIMVDPKVVELGVYNGIPHLMIPVVTEPKQAAGALNWAVQEMMKRYDLFAKNKVRNLAGYNKIAEDSGFDKLPQILIIIDELADLMMVAAKEVEGYICRLAQLARAAGIHLVIATQRPSVDVITGLIKANIPSRAALFVSSQVDSRTILGKGGAEKLLGNGDMLFHPAGLPNAMRVQGAYVSDEEIENVVKFLIENSEENSYAEDLAEHIERCANGENGVAPDEEEDGDELLPQAIRIAIEAGQISTSMVQRRLGVGYARAGRIIDQMESRGIISGANGSKPREVLMTAAEVYGNNIY